MGHYFLDKQLIIPGSSREHTHQLLQGFERPDMANDIVVVYHVTIVAIGHELLKKFWPYGSRLRSTHCREFLYMK